MSGEANDAVVSIHGELERRVAVDPDTMDWQPSPAGQVWRKRLHHVGPPESGQVTSLVHYDPGSHFPPHEHPDGEEILVLDGIFSDERGNWPAGSYLLSPEGFTHAPWSEPGCLLFVKLRQYPGRRRRRVALDTRRLPWRPAPEQPGIEEKRLYAQRGFADRTRLEHWGPGTRLERRYPDGAELLVIDGEFADESGRYRRHGWLRLPRGDRQAATTASGCTLYIKLGGIAYLRAG